MRVLALQNLLRYNHPYLCQNERDQGLQDQTKEHRIAWIYYKLCNPLKVEKYGSRADFFEAVAEEMVNPTTNYTHVKDAQQHNKEVAANIELPDVQRNANMYSMSGYPTKTCTPVPFSALHI
jgi:hypothetical protein